MSQLHKEGFHKSESLSWLLIFSGSYCWKRDRLYSTYMQQLMMKHDACIISGINLSIVLIRLYVQLHIWTYFFFRYENLARVSESFICVRIEAIINFLLYTVLYTNMSLSVEYYAAVKLWIDAVKVSAKEVSCSVIDQFPSFLINYWEFSFFINYWEWSHLRLTRITQFNCN